MSTDGLKSRKVDCWICTDAFFFLSSLTEEAGKWLSWERVSSVSRWSRRSTEPSVGGQEPLFPCGSTPMGGSLTTVPSLPGVSLSHLALFLVTLTLKLLLPLSCPPSPVWRGRPDPAYYLAGGVCGPEPSFFEPNKALEMIWSNIPIYIEELRHSNMPEWLSPVSNEPCDLKHVITVWGKK